jgi:hypothetical protein
MLNQMLALTTGQKLVLMRRWVPEEGARLIRQEGVSAAGGRVRLALQ